MEHKASLAYNLKPGQKSAANTNTFYTFCTAREQPRNVKRERSVDLASGKQILISFIYSTLMKTKVFRLKKQAITLLLSGLVTPYLASAAERIDLANQDIANVEITSSKTVKSADTTPAMITVITAKDLIDRNARDLRTALSLVAGVDIAPGGDGGPASAAPGMWGLREFDAFLLVVDGVPWGGAFNPALSTLSMANVERIEVQRGSAPVMYGATSFVGVIHVIHAAAGDAHNLASIGIGTHQSVNVGVVTNLPTVGGFAQSIYIDASKQAFSQKDAKLNRAHMLYRAAADLDAGKLHIDLDATSLKQKPYSPHPREGKILSTRFPLDANINPRDGKANEDRVQLNLGLDTDVGFGTWSTLLSLAHSRNANVKGFLRGDFEDDGISPNADGFRQDVSTTTGYFDTHLNLRASQDLSAIIGMDWLYGKGTQNSDNFEYGIFPNGSNAPFSSALPVDESTHLSDTRNFIGLYAQVDWKASDRLNLIAGLRYNNTKESREGKAIDHHAPAGEAPFTAMDTQSHAKLSGSVAANYKIWSKDADQLSGFINYRSTFKPSAIDFGPEAEGTILQPETAKSVEAGLKGKLFNGKLEWEFSTFSMDFTNLVIRENIGGLPALANAGSEKFKGSEIEATFRLSNELHVSASYAHHDARFVDYSRAHDGGMQQLGGKRLELSPQNLGAIGLVYAAPRGLQGSLVLGRVGERFLNKGNTAVADAYSMIDAGIGYRFDRWTLRLDGTNLSNSRAPVAESEIGDAQFYRLPGRNVMLSASMSF